MLYRLCTCALLLILFCAELDAASKYRNYRNKQRTCGYEGCPKPKQGMLNVHLVPHSHDDIGWLKTFDQYFYGTKSYIRIANVKEIIDSVIQSLLKDPEKRFIYVESAYFFKWWSQQSNTIQEQVKELVNEGRLEFIGGAWSMNDEATTNYQSVVDQFTYGLRKLNETFGECARPKIGWQIDPYGHSREFASLLTQMGFDGLFVGRIDYEDKINRQLNRNMEMLWHTGDSSSSKRDLFTTVLYNKYNAPPGFCFDITCTDDPIVDDKSSPEYNLEKKLQAFIKFIGKQANTTLTNNIILTMGSEFNYMDADLYFSNLDRLIRHINERQKIGLNVNAFYSTPSCYLKALHDSNITWPTKNDDFYPYASDPHSFWTGYFTTRPTLKRFERVGNHYLQICKQLSVLAEKKLSTFEENLNTLREAMGIVQHHDSIAGSERQHVAEDYSRILQIGIDKCSENIKESLNQLTIKENLKDSRDQTNFRFGFESCADLNISACAVTENSSKFTVTVYNPLAQSTMQLVRFPVSAGEYEILDYKNVSVNSQLVPIPEEVRLLHYRRSKAVNELVFLANELPPLGFKTYFIQKKSITKAAEVNDPIASLLTRNVEFLNDDRESGPFTIGNQYLKLTFGQNGLLESATTNEVEMKVRQNFYLYRAYLKNYLGSSSVFFRPNGSEALEIASSAKVRVIRGDLVDEVHQTFNEWISQVIRVYKNENYVEFKWMVGEIPIADGIGREIITKFETDIKSNGIFYTDSNGRQMMKRKLNHRETWNVTLLEKVAGNYYPVSSKIAIEDTTRRFAILTDRAQGGSSLTDGSIELMVHRRLLNKDPDAVGESLNETAFGKGLIVIGSSYFVLGPKKYSRKISAEANERFVQLQLHLPNSLFFSNVTELSYDTWKNNFKNIYSGLSTSLPRNIHLLTFEPWTTDSILIRFEHILSKYEDEQYSQVATINLQEIFRSFDVVSIKETTLSANQWLDKAVERLQFKSKNEDLNENPINEVLYSNNFDKYADEPKTNNRNDFTITLKPMEIRTFIIEIESIL